MPVGPLYQKMQAATAKVWKRLMDGYQNATLSVMIPTTAPNVDVPLAAVTPTYATTTYTGIVGDQKEFFRVGGGGESLSRNIVKMVIDTQELGGLTFDQFEQLLRKGGAILQVNSEILELFDIQNDLLAEMTVITFVRQQGS